MSAPVPLPAIPAERAVSPSLPPDLLDAMQRAGEVLALATPEDRPVILEAFAQPISADPAAVRAAIGMLTSALEQLGETEISTFGAAMFYRVTMHPEWRDAAARFIDASDEDPIAWMEARPATGLFIGRVLEFVS